MGSQVSILLAKNRTRVEVRFYLMQDHALNVLPDFLVFLGNLLFFFFFFFFQVSRNARITILTAGNKFYASVMIDDNQWRDFSKQ